MQCMIVSVLNTEVTENTCQKQAGGELILRVIWPLNCG